MQQSLGIYVTAVIETVNMVNICLCTNNMSSAVCNLRYGCKDDLHEVSYVKLWVDIKGLLNK